MGRNIAKKMIAEIVITTFLGFALIIVIISIGAKYIVKYDKKHERNRRTNR